MHLSHRAGAARRTEGAEPANGGRPGGKNTTALCADAHGFSLHAAVRCGAHQCKELGRLCRHITRPAITNERLKRDGAGDVVLQLKSAWRDGTTHIRMSPLEFMQRLAAPAQAGTRTEASARNADAVVLGAETDATTRLRTKAELKLKQESGLMEAVCERGNLKLAYRPSCGRGPSRARCRAMCKFASCNWFPPLPNTSNELR